ncbi:hypothetical protein [Sporosarcina limicola]|uniref:Chromosome segregation ATPase n=1 Tax=Sporosarcina limicola TaxID=34101 RepID=A0A927MEW2_9BACL|nr:hypothetical protein [Sporosarcina limicola]MBE1553373.1 chromosome segregation ATPase [Sporosarcina limicola]
MENNFDLILNELREIHGSIRKLDERVGKLDERVGSLESGQKELFQITRAILDCQEEADAKLEILSMDVHRLHGDVKELKVRFIDISKDVEFTYLKTSKHEMEIYKIKQDLDMRVSEDSES